MDPLCLLDTFFQCTSGSTLSAKFEAAQVEISKTLQRLSTLQSYACAVQSAMNRQTSIIRDLPPEVVCQIFRWVALEDSGRSVRGLESKTRPRLSNLMILSAVCREWRMICHSFPHLWQSIDWTLGSSVKDWQDGSMPRLVESWVERAPKPSFESSVGDAGLIDLFIFANIGSTYNHQQCKRFLEQYGARLRHVEYGKVTSPYMLDTPMPHVRSLSFYANVPLTIAYRPLTFGKAFPRLEVLEVGMVDYGTCPAELTARIGQGSTHTSVIAGDLAPTQLERLQKIVIRTPNFLPTLLFLHAFSRTLVHLRIGSPVYLPPSGNCRAVSEKDILEAVEDVDLFRLETIDIGIPGLWEAGECPPSMEGYPIAFLKRLKASYLRRVRCTLGSPGDFDVNILRWAVSLFGGENTSTDCHPADADLLANLGCKRTRPGLLLIESPFLSTLIPKILQTLKMALRSIYAAGSEAMDVTVILLDTSQRKSQMEVSRSPPSLDLDMDALMPCPEDPYWDRNVYCIFPAAGITEGRPNHGNDCYSAEGKPVAWLSRVPARLWGKCEGGL